MKKLRLLVTKNCDRSCPGCCNKDWNLDKLPDVTHFNFDEIILTGGEPLLYISELIDLIGYIRNISKAKIILYTAYTKNLSRFFAVLYLIDGITVTLHDQNDVKNFIPIHGHMKNNLELFNKKSLRLNIFKGINYSNINTSMWQIKDNIKWIKNCPLPEDEIFQKI